MSRDAQVLRGITAWDGVNDLGTVDLTWKGGRIEEVASAPKARYDELSVIPGLIDTCVRLCGPATDACTLGEPEPGAGRHASAGPNSRMVPTVRPGSWPGAMTWPGGVWTAGAWTAGAWTAGMAPDLEAWERQVPWEDQVLHLAAQARAAMRRGITSMRVTGDRRQLAIRNAFDSGLLLGPRLFVSGVIQMTGGCPDAPPAGRERGGAYPSPVADGPDECRKLVRTYAAEGVDGLAVAACDGGQRNGRVARRGFTREEIRSVVEEAHALGLSVVAQAATESGIEAVLQEGVDAIEQGTLITPKQAGLAAKRGLTLVPGRLLNEWPGRENRAKIRALAADRHRRLRAAREVGVSFVLGTGSNGHDVPFGSALSELAMHRDVLGLTDAKALTAGTSGAAAALGHSGTLGQGGTLGRITPGFAADFLVVRGKPWKSITLLREENIVAVVCRGRVAAGALPQ